MYVILYAKQTGLAPAAPGEREKLMLHHLLPILLGYLLGSSSMSYYISRMKKIDLRSGGSGNLGASNAMLMMGWPSAVAVTIHDLGKAALAVILARMLFPAAPLAGALAGVAAVFGHVFPFYLKFKGGKGFAAYLGMTVALNWKFAIALLIAVVVITVVTDYIVMATTTTITVVPVYMGIATGSLLFALVLLCGTALIFWKHRENYVRLVQGTEIGLRSGASGKHRAKKPDDKE